MEVVTPDELLLDVLDKSRPELVQILALYGLFLAFHLSYPNKEQRLPLKVLVPSRLTRDAKIVAATRLVEAVMEPTWTPSVGVEEDRQVAFGIFLALGGFESLRYAMSVRSLERRLRRARRQMRQIGRVSSIPIRITTVKGEKPLSFDAVVKQIVSDPTYRSAFNLRYARTKTNNWDKRLRPVTPFAHLVYVTGRARSTVGRIPRLNDKRFVDKLRAIVRDREAVLRFIASYNGTCSDLNNVGYACTPLAVPAGENMPIVQITHEPWPASLIY